MCRQDWEDRRREEKLLVEALYRLCSGIRPKCKAFGTLQTVIVQKVQNRRQLEASLWNIPAMHRAYRRLLDLSKGLGKAFNMLYAAKEQKFDNYIVQEASAKFWGKKRCRGCLNVWWLVTEGTLYNADMLALGIAHNHNRRRRGFLQRITGGVESKRENDSLHLKSFLWNKDKQLQIGIKKLQAHATILKNPKIRGILNRMRLFHVSKALNTWCQYVIEGECTEIEAKYTKMLRILKSSKHTMTLGSAWSTWYQLTAIFARNEIIIREAGRRLKHGAKYKMFHHWLFWTRLIVLCAKEQDRHGTCAKSREQDIDLADWGIVDN